jgi:F-type H+-transporting ATPase subunit delta
MTDANAYARAVYETAISSWQDSLNAVSEKLATSNGLLAKLDDVQVKFTSRQAELDKLLSADTPQQVRNFLYTLMKAGDLHLVDGVAKNLGWLGSKGPQVQVAVVTTAISLTSSEQAEFEKKLQAKHGEEIVVDFKVDESILGGVIVQVGDQIIDGSVVSKLNTVQHKLSVG